MEAVKILPALNSDAEKVFNQLRAKKAMPILEIAGLTGIYGNRLKEIITHLSEKHLITISSGQSPAHNIVTISGKYF